MKLVEQHIIHKSNNNWNQIDNLCFLSKNLYNVALFIIKHEYLLSGKVLRYNELEKKLKTENNIDYRNLPSSVSQQILMILDKNIKSYFGLLKLWKKNKNNLSGCPKFPKYKDKIKGRNIIVIRGDINVSKVKSDGIHLPKKLNLSIIKSKNIKEQNQLNQIRIIPLSSHYKIEIIYEVKEKEFKQTDNKASIDLGLNNLSVLTATSSKSIIINGKPLKAINQFYNKNKAKLQSELKKKHNKFNSNKINKLTIKRDNKIKDYLHKSSRIIVDYLTDNNIDELVVGYNKEWKQEINLGKKNNQNFVNIPFNNYIKMIEYKCLLEGIKFKTIEESYTSKCSSIDLEPIKKHDKYKGSRVKRGLYITANGLKLNADVNGSLNIGRKEFGDAFMPTNIGLVVNPIKITSL